MLTSNTTTYQEVWSFESSTLEQRAGRLAPDAMEADFTLTPELTIEEREPTKRFKPGKVKIEEHVDVF